MVADYLDLTRLKDALEEYFGLLETSDKRWEYWDGEFLCMFGDSPAHALKRG